MSNIKIQIDGLKELTKTLNNINIGIPKEVAKGMNKEAREIFQESQSLVPYDTGRLKSSGKINEATPNNLNLDISYNTPYAVRQHEDMSYHHPGGKNAKYLERPFKARIDNIYSTVKKAILNGVSKWRVM